MVRNALVTSVMAIACLCAFRMGGLEARLCRWCGLIAGFPRSADFCSAIGVLVWVNGLTDTRQMTRELEELKAKGSRGCISSTWGRQDPQKIVPAGPAFMGTGVAGGHWARRAGGDSAGVGGRAGHIEQLELRRSVGDAGICEHGALSLSKGREGAQALLRIAADADAAKERASGSGRKTRICPDVAVLAVREHPK